LRISTRTRTGSSSPPRQKGKGRNAVAPFGPKRTSNKNGPLPFGQWPTLPPKSRFCRNVCHSAARRPQNLSLNLAHPRVSQQRFGRLDLLRLLQLLLSHFVLPHLICPIGHRCPYMQSARRSPCAFFVARKSSFSSALAARAIVNSIQSAASRGTLALRTGTQCAAPLSDNGNSRLVLRPRVFSAG